jgi:UDP-glucose 4-epimerase
LVADISRPDAFASLAGRAFEAVIHCAAQASNALSFQDPARDLYANQLATLNVLNFCRDNHIGRLIFTSSMSVYGNAHQLPTPETALCVPESYYAVHKLASEHYLRLFGQRHGIAWTIFRLYTTYGYGQNLFNRDQGLVSIYLSYVLRGERLVVKGAADRRRDLVHVSDVVAAILATLDEPRTHYRIYNLGTGQSLAVEEIVKLVITEAGHDPTTYPVEYTTATLGDPHSTLADITQIQQDLGWSPRVMPVEGLRATVRGYLQAESKTKQA